MGEQIGNLYAKVMNRLGAMENYVRSVYMANLDSSILSLCPQFLSTNDGVDGKWYHWLGWAIDTSVDTGMVMSVIGYIKTAGSYKLLLHIMDADQVGSGSWTVQIQGLVEDDLGTPIVNEELTVNKTGTLDHVYTSAFSVAADKCVWFYFNVKVGTTPTSKMALWGAEFVKQ